MNASNLLLVLAVITAAADARLNRSLLAAAVAFGFASFLL